MITKPMLPAILKKEEWEDIVKWRPNGDIWTKRDEVLHKTAWCILTEETSVHLGKWLSKFNSVIEVFAGTGYIAEHLRQASGLSRKQYRAYDAALSHWRDYARPNYGFTKAGCFNVNLKKADCIVMTWPNYDDNLAYRIARKMVPGQYLLYNGETEGGCTGNYAFFEHLKECFEEVEYMSDRLYDSHVQWMCAYDDWRVYKKKTN